MGLLKLIFNTLFAWVPYDILMELYTLALGNMVHSRRGDGAYY